MKLMEGATKSSSTSQLWRRSVGVSCTIIVYHIVDSRLVDLYILPLLAVEH